MKRWQAWLIVITLSVFIAGSVGVVYYFFTKDTQVEKAPEQTPVVVEDSAVLGEVEKNLQEVDELNLTDLEAAGKELEAVDLSGL